MASDTTPTADPDPHAPPGSRPGDHPGWLGDLGVLGVLGELLGLRLADQHRSVDDDAASSATLGLVGDLGQPRFLVPLDHRAATSAALLAYNRLRPVRTRVGRVAVATATRLGGQRLTMPLHVHVDRGPGSLIGHLADLLDTPRLQVAVGIGNVDDVWKPTLQCFTPTGEPTAYVKIGVGAVGAHLVSHERLVLEAWAAADDPRLVVPLLVATSTWQGHPVNCAEPMPIDARRLPPGPVSAWPARQLDPPVPDAPLAAAPWWTGRVRDHVQHPDVGPLLAAVTARHDGPDRSWARWHGDWVPWNQARSRRGLVVWDWEYSEPGAPVGLDEAHGTYQQARFGRQRSVPEAFATVRRATADEWVADAQLVALATRHTLLEQLSGRPVGDHHDVMAEVRRRAAALQSLR